MPSSIRAVSFGAFQSGAAWEQCEVILSMRIRLTVYELGLGNSVPLSMSVGFGR